MSSRGKRPKKNPYRVVQDDINMLQEFRGYASMLEFELGDVIKRVREDGTPDEEIAPLIEAQRASSDAVRYAQTLLSRRLQVLVVNFAPRDLSLEQESSNLFVAEKQLFGPDGKPINEE